VTHRPLIAVVTVMLATALPSCERNECDDRQTGLERDTCLYEQIQALGGTDVDEVRDIAQTIDDSVVRSAAVDSWLREHRGTVATDKGIGLCELLEPAAYGRCRRWFSAAHLQR